MPVKFRCPGCRQAYSISRKKIGTSLTCQKCGAKIKVPDVDGGGGDEPPVPEKPSRSQTAQPQDDLFDGVKPQTPQEGVEFKDAAGNRPGRSSGPKSSRTPAAANPEFVDDFLDDNDFLDEDDFLDPGDATGSSAKTSRDQPVVESATTARPPEAPSLDIDHGDEDDDLGAVLAFEQALENHEGPVAAPQMPLPDELFAEDEDDEEEESYSRAGEDEEMDLTPMVDVTFLLLIFFMITASFSIQKTLEVPNPDPDEKGASTSQSIKDIEETSVEVNVDERDVITVDDEPIGDPARLADKLRATRMTEVLITSHENASHELVVKCVDAANEVGMLKIRMGITR